jgi:uncharacterized membrane protein YvlD (DUF360 family)
VWLRLPATKASVAVALFTVCVCDALVRPVADALVASQSRAVELVPFYATEVVLALPRPVRAQPHPWAAIGPIVKCLAALRDSRVLPVLRCLLAEPAPRVEVITAAIEFGVDRDELVPVIHNWLRSQPTGTTRVELLGAVERIGAAAASLVPVLQQLLPDRRALRALAAIGPAAAAALPAVDQILDHPDPRTAIGAASARWFLTGDPEPARLVLAQHLDGDPAQLRDAATLVAALGTDAASQAPRLRSLLDSLDGSDFRRHGEVHWSEAAVALAVASWRATGDAEPVLPVLEKCWHHPFNRTEITSALAQIGPAGAPAAPLLRAELTSRRRSLDWSIPADQALTALYVGVIFGLVNAVIKPIVTTLTFPLFVVTLGLFTFIANALLFWLTAWFAAVFNLDFVVDGFWAAFLGALVVTIVSWGISLVVRR